MAGNELEDYIQAQIDASRSGDESPPDDADDAGESLEGLTEDEAADDPTPDTSETIGDDWSGITSPRDLVAWAQANESDLVAAGWDDASDFLRLAATFAGFAELSQQMPGLPATAMPTTSDLPPEMRAADLAERVGGRVIAGGDPLWPGGKGWGRRSAN